LSHPFHLHGYSFNVIGMGRSPDKNVKKINLKHALDLDRRGLLDRHFNLPPNKDTIAVPNNGYVVFRFRADNPGKVFVTGGNRTYTGDAGHLRYLRAVRPVFGSLSSAVILFVFPVTVRISSAPRIRTFSKNAAADVLETTVLGEKREELSLLLTGALFRLVFGFTVLLKMGRETLPG